MLRAVRLILLTLVLAACVDAAVSVSADLQPRDLQVGETATLTITVDGVQDSTPPDLGGLDGFELNYLGPSTQVSFVNGQVTARVQHRYALLAQRPGTFTLGPFDVEAGGTSQKTVPISVNVRAATTAPSGGAPRAQGQSPAPEALRLQLAARKTEAYVNEPIPVDLTLYVGAVGITDVQYPQLASAGMSVDKFPEPSQRKERIEGTTYQVVRFHTTVVPLRAGSQTLGPAAMRLSVLERRRGRGANDPFFGRFFDDPFFSDKRPIELRSNDIPLTILPLPETGKPAHFGGAVGQFTLDVTAGPSEVQLGDPVTVRMRVAGTGNLADGTPRFIETTGFKAYDSTVTGAEQSGASTTKSFEQVLLPTEANVHAVPSVRFAYFDPAERRYRTAESQPIALVVRPAQGSAAPRVLADAPAASDRAPEQLGRDIVYIKDAPGDLVAGPVGGSSILFLLWLPVPVALFAAAAYHDRHRRLLHGDPRYARFSRAGRAAREGLATAAAELAAGNRAGFYDATSRTVQSYLAAKLDLPPGAVDIEAIAARGMPADTVELVRTLFDTCERARFAPGAAAENLQGVLDVAQEVVRRLERTRSYGARSGVIALAAIVACLGSGERLAHAADPATPQTAFFEGNSAYRAGNYRNAIDAYEQVRSSGHASAALYFNLGNAYFKEGDRGRAILNYERARALAPRDPDLLANLTYAESVAGLDPCTPAIWQQIAFPLASHLTLAGLLWATAAAYTGCFLILALQRLLPARPRWLGWCAVGLGTLALWTGAATAYRLVRERTPAAAVVAAGESAVRFEPVATGTVHFSLQAGAVVRIAGDREGWVQVTRCDGRRGWIERLKVEALWGE